VAPRHAGATAPPAPAAPAASGDLHPTAGGTVRFAADTVASCEPGGHLDRAGAELAAGAIIAALQTGNPPPPSWFKPPPGYQLPPARVVSDPSNDVAPMVVLMTEVDIGWLVLATPDGQVTYCLTREGPTAFAIARAP
jgi:hypothetical protein